MHACMHACMDACIHTCMHACMHTYIHTYIHTCIHIYILKHSVSACDCSTLGSIPDTGYRCQNSTGQCDCKLNVQGRRCDTCKDEYWNLVGSNQFGCQSEYVCIL